MRVKGPSALVNRSPVGRAAGGAPESVGRLTVYVTDKDEYLRRRRELGPAWRERFGRHYPAMALVEVNEADLVPIHLDGAFPQHSQSARETFGSQAQGGGQHALIPAAGISDSCGFRRPR